MSIIRKTALFQEHINANAKMVEFCNWQMPINYGSQVKEHEAVRLHSGMFDVSHMVITDIVGDGAKDFLRYILSNDVVKLDVGGIGRALYSAMLNKDAGVIDDLIVYLMPFGYRLVTNAGTYESDLNWLNKIKPQFNINLVSRSDLSILALQGPIAIEKILELKPELKTQLELLKPFNAYISGDWCFARTGYTGENGLEIMLPNNDVVELWRDLLGVGVIPCGLAARDTLRLEAGMNLYGHDMNETITPLSCNMDWVVDLKDKSRNFIGRDSYERLKSSNDHDIQVGLILTGRGVLREGQKLYNESHDEIGVITSGTFSPTLKLSIAMARIRANTEANILVDIRGNYEVAKIVKLPFYRGKINV